MRVGLVFVGCQRSITGHLWWHLYSRVRTACTLVGIVSGVAVAADLQTNAQLVSNLCTHKTDSEGKKTRAASFSMR